MYNSVIGLLCILQWSCPIFLFYFFTFLNRNDLLVHVNLVNRFCFKNKIDVYVFGWYKGADVILTRRSSLHCLQTSDQLCFLSAEVWTPAEVTHKHQYETSLVVQQLSRNVRGDCESEDERLSLLPPAGTTGDWSQTGSMLQVHQTHTDNDVLPFRFRS